MFILSMNTEHTLPSKCLGSAEFFMFLMESLMLIKAVFIWSKHWNKQKYCEILLQILNIGFLF